MKKKFFNGLKDFYTAFFTASVINIVKIFYVALFKGAMGTAAFVFAVNGLAFWVYLGAIFTYLAFYEDMYEEKEDMVIAIIFGVLSFIVGLFL
jgi:heme O synthase-like polyprenyltransferase